MQISKKCISLILVITTLFCLMNVGAAVFAATPASQTVKVEAGETVKLVFSETAYGIDGDIRYDNRDLFSSITPDTESRGSVTANTFVFYGSKKLDLEFWLTVKISDTAAVGDQCTVTFEYLRVDDNMTGEGPDGLVKTITVEVVEKETTTTESKIPTTTTTEPKDPTTTTKPKDPTTTTKPQTPTTTTVASNLDLKELNTQIGIAESLDEVAYTADSWDKMEKALTAAKKARKAKTQKEVNTAADNLKQAIAGLVRIDNSKLQDLLTSVKTYLDDDTLSDAKDALLKAIADAEEALTSGDQTKIDDAYTALSAAFEAYKAALEKLGGTIVEVEKPVEVEPQGPYCNVWLHRLWLILLIVSAVINMAFVVLTILYFVRRKKNLTDDTPLVDYDINDD